MNRFIVASLFFLSCSANVLLAQGQSVNADRMPDDIEARPPIRLRAKPSLASGPSGYTPAQVRKAYGVDQITGTGTGQIIAIVDAYGSSTIQNDLNKFCTQYGLPQTTVAIYYPQGKPSKTDAGWALETALDVQWAHAIAPGAKIIVVVAKTASLSNLLSAVDYAVKQGAKQVSMSWGAAEFSTEARYNTYFNKPGVTFTAASGDSGAGVMWPASSPYVVSVGGTTLTLDGAGNVISENAWSGSGGGFSAYEPQPAYQNVWQNTGKRGVPDVSYNADPNTGFPVYIGNYNGAAGWITVGGTSAGAPQWAALIALTNAARAVPLSAAGSVLYSVAFANNYANYSVCYRDITSGSNGFLADTFYDFVTGLGSPRADKLVPVLRTK